MVLVSLGVGNKAKNVMMVTIRSIISTLLNLAKQQLLNASKT